ncbi:MAG: hypothetical protein KGL39_33090 [Patescibacteria group bacterium]|nr:hypothetical protein [Patescibacteria group bacterium]
MNSRRVVRRENFVEMFRQVNEKHLKREPKGGCRGTRRSERRKLARAYADGEWLRWGREG